MKTKEIFDTLNADGDQIKLAVKYPSAKVQQKANVIYASTFKDVIKGSYLRSELEAVLIEKGVWDAEKQKRLEELQAGLVINERKLLAGGIRKSEGKKIALEMVNARTDIRLLVADRANYDAVTVEGQCENAKFNYLVSQCTVYNDSGELYFLSYDDYLERADEIAAQHASVKLMNMLYNVDEDVNANLPETKFLKEHKFINDKYHLIDEQGRLIDASGRLVDENGRYVDETGKFIDYSGNPVDAEGNFVVESKPFLDDNDQPLVEDAKVETPAKKTRKSKVKS